MQKESHNRILDYYSKTNTPFLHAGGAIATDYLLSRMSIRPGDSVLEIGFGTGATLVRLASENTGIRLEGVEISQRMMAKAKSRLRFSGLSGRVRALSLSANGRLPFPDASFDMVVAESVLGIQEGDDLPRSVAEIARVLKPGGRLFLNETVWLNSTSAEQIGSINEFCRTRFGIIQASGTYPYREDWKRLMESRGFSVSEIIGLNSLEHVKSIRFTGIHAVGSALFSIVGRLTGRGPAANKSYKASMREMREIVQDKPVMEGLFMMAVKKI